MADTDRNGNQGTETVVPESTTGTGQGEKDSSTTESGKRGRGRPRTTSTDTGTATAEKEGISGLVVINKEETPTEPPTPKKAKQKRKRTKKNDKNDSVFNAEQITAIFMTASAILSNSETAKIFALSEAEAKQIAEPLANIIAKNDSLSGLAEHSDSIALVTACFMIFVPKLVIFFTIQKQKKVLKEKGVKIIKEDKTNVKTGKTSSDSGRVNRNDTSDNATNVNGTLSTLPSIM